MTELERRALMGDREAQEECTRQGIVLNCPFCGGNTSNTDGTIFKIRNSNLYAHKRTGKCFLDGEIIYSLLEWNTRPAPPVGRCDDCARRYEENGVYFCSNTNTECGDDDFCSYFEPKGDEENADD